MGMGECQHCGKHYDEGCFCEKEFEFQGEIETLEGRAAAAIELAVKYGGIDGDHHKAWVIDQMVRVLAGERYPDVVREACDGADGPDTYRWDEGVAP